MAWAAPKTWVASAILTAAELNVHLRDNLNATFPALVSAKGDSVWASGANAGVRVAVAASGLLIADSTCNAGVRWSTCATVNASTGEFRNTAAADVSPFTQARLTVYRDTSNWGYLAYGSDGVLRTVYSSDVGVKSTHWGISNSTSGTGAFTAWMALTTCGVLTIGGSVVNANMTTGLTIQQGAADDEILALKSSDVAHGITSISETDSYLALRKISATAGGVLAYCMSDGGQQGIQVVGISGGAADTTRNNTSVGVVYLDGAVKSGTTYVPAAASGNIFGVGTGGSARMLLDGAGNLYLDATAVQNAFDKWDDAQMCRALALSVSPCGIIEQERDRFLKYNRKHLQAANVATYNEDGGIFVNHTALAWLLVGSVGQLSDRLAEAEDRNFELAGCLMRLAGRSPCARAIG